MKKDDDSRQMQLNLDATDLVSTKNLKIQKKQTKTASVLKFSTKVEQKNNSKLKQLYGGILKGVEHIK